MYIIYLTLSAIACLGRERRSLRMTAFLEELDNKNQRYWFTSSILVALRIEATSIELVHHSDRSSSFIVSELDWSRENDGGNYLARNHTFFGVPTFRTSLLGKSDLLGCG